MILCQNLTQEHLIILIQIHIKVIFNANEKHSKLNLESTIANVLQKKDIICIRNATSHAKSNDNTIPYVIPESRSQRRVINGISI